jgi:hypothetical protein
MYIREITNQSSITQEVDFAISEIVSIGDSIGEFINPKREG